MLFHGKNVTSTVCCWSNPCHAFAEAISPEGTIVDMKKISSDACFCLLLESSQRAARVQASVTPAMFKTALHKLGQNAFDIDEVELEHLITTFDANGNGTVELEEFMTFCLSIPSLPWRAEKVRR